MTTRTPEMEAIAAKARERAPLRQFGYLNGYRCTTCSAEVFTIDREEGVTPFGIEHKWASDEPCKEPFLTSRMYRVEPTETPTLEWYRPDTLDGLTPGERDHVERGGLLLRAIAEPDEPFHRLRSKTVLALAAHLDHQVCQMVAVTARLNGLTDHESQALSLALAGTIAGRAEAALESDEEGRGIFDACRNDGRIQVATMLAAEQTKQ